MEGTADGSIYEFGDFRVDAGRRQLQLKADGRPLPLTSKAFEMLLVFIERRGELLDKNTLMKAVWPNVIVEENNLNQCISTLRRVFGDSRDEHRFIVTIPGRGYRFVADVRVLTATATPASEVAPVPASPPPKLASELHPRTSPQRSAMRWFGLAAVLLAAAALTWLFVHRGQAPVADSVSIAPQMRSAAGSTAGTPRLAIMPFANLSPDASNAFFADGLYEEILSTLAERMPGVAVISRTTMLSYRQNPKPLSEVSSELGATHVMEGTVRREGNRVRLTLQLVDAGTDHYLWSQTYDRTLSSAMTLQTEVAAEVATQLSVRLSGDATRAAPMTHDAEAYDLYLQALVSFRDVDPTVGSQSQALEDLLNRALDRDPKFAQAYAQRARLHTLLMMANSDVSERNYRSASDDIAAARRLAPNDPVVLAAFGYLMLADGQFSRSVEAIQAAEAAGLYDAVWLIPKARALLSLGRVEEAVKVHEQMLSLDPANPLVLNFTISHLLLVQRPQAAQRVGQLGARVFEQLGQPWNAYLRFIVHGDVEPLSKAIGPHPPNSNAPASVLKDPVVVATNFGALRFEHRYADLARFLERVPVPTLISTGDENQLFDCVGARPTAEYRGWAYLLANERARVKEQGDAVLAFVHSEAETKWNRFFLRLLAAEAYTFTGQKEQAIAAAREGLGLMPRSVNAVAWVGAASLAARVYAWNGADEEAAKLLEELASAAPGQQPAFIAMDPLLTLPLAHNVRFQSLVARLDKQMRETPT